ncbi:dTDP-4-dehydrorhamnose reductase [SAR86 cluster bacterium]|nr:dTDP-4-dehydrorhamnose reductase [SAR86 cluster bacterium]
MKKILVLGSTGQIGTALKKDLTKWFEVTFLSRNDLDFADIESLSAKLKDFKPDFIINSAAYTNVDQAEEFQENAFQVNSLAVEKLSKLANSIGAVLVHFSTDYVFDGKKNTPYTEIEIPNPLSIYGKSKLEGEQFVEKNCSKFLILRTSGVISKNNDNFVSKIKKLSKTKKELSVINDQITAVNFSSYIAEATSKILRKIEDNTENENRWGIYHMSGRESGSWFDFACHAQKINALSDPKSSFSQIKILPISSIEFNQKAKRPNYSFLTSDKLKNDFGISLPNWEKSISEVIR